MLQQWSNPPFRIKTLTAELYSLLDTICKKEMEILVGIANHRDNGEQTMKKYFLDS